MQDDFEKLFVLYPDLRNRKNPDVKPKYKIVARMLDRHINLALNGKPGIKRDRGEELTVTFHTAGQSAVWTIPIIAALEDKEIINNMAQTEVDALRFVFNYDNSVDENNEQ